MSPTAGEGRAEAEARRGILTWKVCREGGGGPVIWMKVDHCLSVRVVAGRPCVCVKSAFREVLGSLWGDWESGAAEVYGAVVSMENGDIYSK